MRKFYPIFTNPVHCGDIFTAEGRANITILEVLTECVILRGSGTEVLLASNQELIDRGYGQWINKTKWEPKKEATCFLASPDASEKYRSLYWDGRDYDKTMLERGLVFETQEEAIALADKMIELAKFYNQENNEA